MLTGHALDSYVGRRLYMYRYFKKKSVTLILNVFIDPLKSHYCIFKRSIEIYQILYPEYNKQSIKMSFIKATDIL